MRGTNQTIDIFKLADLTRTKDGPLRVARDNEMHTPVFPNGAAICEVEVDPETGHVRITSYATVDDVGRCINPLIVHGQTHGGIAQGVGQAMWEHCDVDAASGQPLAGSFMDYAMPRSDNMPSFICEIAEVISPTNPLGIKAGGEGGTTPALATVVNAILDALKDYGVTDIQMPVTPEAVWRAIHERHEPYCSQQPKEDQSQMTAAAKPMSASSPFRALRTCRLSRRSHRDSLPREALSVELSLTAKLGLSGAEDRRRRIRHRLHRLRQCRGL